MGMAASQARYLALSARKTNCEYEGQQINQQRLTLSNQSADLFNQMLTMSVPTPPSTTDFTTLQYSWSDGNMTFVLDEYYQLGKPDPQFNYVTSSYHYENVYTGQRKFLNDPQVQAKKTNHFSDAKTTNYTVQTISYNPDKDTYTFGVKNRFDKELSIVYKPSSQNSSKDVREQLDYMYNTVTKEDNVDAFSYDATTNKITYNAKTFDYIDPETASADTLKALKQTYGAFYDSAKKYYKTSDGEYVCKDDIDTAQLTRIGPVIVRNEDKNTYYTDGTNYISLDAIKSLNIGDTMTVITAQNNPTFSDYTAVGNSALTMLTKEEYESDAAIQTELKQILQDMGGDSGDKKSYERLKACFDEDGNYINGTLYTFKMSGKTYYTTTADLDESLASAYDKKSVADNSIDSQQSKLSYYNAIYLRTKITEVKKALLETDGKGRFSTVKFEDDSVVYTLNVETIKDDEAYDNAMNQYYFKKEQYDKQVADINAKTEILQAQDRQLQLKLEQLNTEQSALQTEMEACQKVVSKDIENSFKTFGG